MADDHDTVLDGLAAIFASVNDINVVGRARNGEELLRMLPNKPVDVLLLDIAMPVISGLEALPRLKRDHPKLRVIMLSGNNTYNYISGAIAAGADGYLTKDADRQEIVRAVKAVHAGRRFYNTEVADALLKGQTQRQTAATPVVLTARERLIVCLISKELTSREIGDKLGISVLTVERHRRNIFAKLQVKNVVGLVLYAFENGLTRGACEDLE